VTSMNYRPVTDLKLSKLPAKDRLLVLVTSSSIKDLGVPGFSEWRPVEELCWSEHGVSVDAGYLLDHGIISVIVSWESHQPITSFEKRWLVAKRMRELKQVIQAKHIDVCLLDETSQLAQVIAEDIWGDSKKPTPDSQLADDSDHDLFVLENDSSSTRQTMRQNRADGFLGCRSWVNENPDEMTSLRMVSELSDFARDHDCAVTVLEEADLLKEQMNLLLAVGQGSVVSPPRLIVLKNKEAQSTGAKPHILVGKGITFDTGGINVKPYESFVHCMKNDMGGAALMAQLFKTAVRCGYSGPLALVIPACENLVGSRAMKPGSVVTSRSGKRVMIEHTDAEGRLILADALSYAQDLLQPESTWIAATLTTAALRQFSNYFTPVHFSSPDEEHEFRQAGERWGELYTFWQQLLPFSAANKTSSADLTNLGMLKSHASMGCGSNVAAHFLREFISGPVTHFDIFASGWNWSGDYPGGSYGATGAPFNSMLDVLMRHGGKFCGSKVN
jgi:leucyl aminopeptidase